MGLSCRESLRKCVKANSNKATLDGKEIPSSNVMVLFSIIFISMRGDNYVNF